MENLDFEILACPLHKIELKKDVDAQSLICSFDCHYPICRSYIDFLSNSGSESGDLNKKFQKFYDGWASIDLILGPIFRFFFKSRLLKFRQESLAEVFVKPDDKVLEVSIGMGDNLKYLPKEATYFGLDISKKSLERCRKYLDSWGRQASLFAGNAECLPFKDSSFDVVFHIGGINFFDDRARAISEMIRVAKPGTKIVIVDETEQYVEGWYKKVPFLKQFFQSYDKTRTKTPIDLVPKNMIEIKEQLICDNSMYLLSFITPEK